MGWLLGAFVIIYTVASPFCGYLADRVARRYVIGSAVALWSVATALASRAPSFGPLFFLRGTVGVGEAGYNAAGQALLVDLFPPQRRNNVLALFNAAVPVGSAIGFVLGGLLPTLHFGGAQLGWRGACLWVGVPGLVLAACALMLPSPAPAARAVEADGKDSGIAGTLAAYKRFLTDRIYVTNALGYAMQCFALGGLSAFAPSYFIRTHHLEHKDAATLAGGIVVAAGAIGTLLGTVLADRLARGNLIRSYGLVTGVGYLLAGPILALGLFLPFKAAVALMFLSMVGTFLGTGPTNAICTERAPASHRASAFALLVVIIHVLGDAASPVAVGNAATWLETHGLDPDVALQRALVITCGALVVGGFLMFLCAYFAHHEGGADRARESLPKTEGNPAIG